MKELKKTFWQVISNYGIEIPTIQRDYTYGRKSAENIRKKMVKAIFNAINNEEDSIPLHLDFVYGKLEGVDNFELLDRNKQSINTLLHSLKNYANNLHIDVNFNTIAKNSESSEIITFIPLDGQQRLTTLFLIHWYLAKKTKNIEAIKYLNKFNYATRNSSKEFLQMLCALNIKFNKENLLSETIKNNELFFTFWKKDSTVNSMLVVLDEIDEVFKEINYQTAWNNLTVKNRITFDFFDLEAFEQTDELYVKMNARGKKLTHFENFKAWLIKNHQKNIAIIDWKKKIDLEWNDLFWKAKEENITKIDVNYLQFFKNTYLGDYLLSEPDILDNVDNIRLTNNQSPVSIFEKTTVFSNNIESYLLLLTYLTINKTLLETSINPNYIKNTLAEFILRDNKNYTWWDATFYYALTRFIIHNKGSDANFKDWLRVISNLIYNTPIESPKLYKEACNSINILISKINNQPVTNVISSFGANDISFFNPKQKEEEIQKAKLIVENENWKKTLIKLEYHNYFYGQIGFLLNLIEFDNLEDFKIKTNKFELLFSEENLEDSFLLNRLFLSYKECFVQRGSNLMFYTNDNGTLRNRNENWRLVFSNHSDILKEMLEIDSFTNEALEKIIFKNINEKNLPNYLKTLIKTSDTFQYMRKRCLRKYGNESLLLLSTTRIFGYYAELHTYSLFLNSEKEFQYLYAKNEEEIPKIKHLKTKTIISFDYSRNILIDFTTNSPIDIKNLQHA